MSGIISLLFIPRLDQDCIQDEDVKFREYLEEQGYDVSKMGLPIKVVDGTEHIESVEERRESDGTVVEEDKIEGGEGSHTREVPAVKAVRKTTRFFRKATAVAP